MKTIQAMVLAVLTVSSLNAQALITGGRECANSSGIEDSGKCTLMTTTSLPTMIVDGQAYDLNTQESDARLVVEAYGHAELVLIGQLAQELQVSEARIVAEVKAQGSQATVRSVLEAL